jgi:hypothetical protein
VTAAIVDEPRLHTGRQAAALGRRAVVRFARQPSSWVPATVFPLLLVAVNSSAMGGVANIPGVVPPGTTFLMFLLPAAIVQGVMFGGINGGSELEGFSPGAAAVSIGVCLGICALGMLFATRQLQRRLAVAS